MAEDIKIIHVPSDDEPFAVIDKPRFLPSAPLYEGDDSAFTRAAAVYPFLLGVNGKKPCEHGLLHRIDTLTSGLLLIASTQAAYESLSAAQDSGLFVKTYRAVCRQLIGQELCGFAPLPQDFNIETFLTCKQNYTVKSKFRPYSAGSKQVRPVTEYSGEAARKKATGREYTTFIIPEKNCSVRSDSVKEIFCSITSGYRHQVRCHLAWLGLPVKNDPLYDPCYNPDCTHEESFDFSAVRIEFPNPVTGKKEIFSLV